jgi:Subtilase family/Secretion system C-terminal sorting domain
MKKIKTLVFLLLIGFSAHAQTKEQIKKIVSTYDTVAIKKAIALTKMKDEEKAKKFLQMTKLKEWPLKRVDVNGDTMHLIDMTNDGQPVYILSLSARAGKSTRTDDLHTGGSLGLDLNGENMTAYIWEAQQSARITHREFARPNGTSRLSFGDSDRDNSLDQHANFVTGIIIANGEYYPDYVKGMAPKANAVLYGAQNDQTEAGPAILDGMLVSNHSYLYFDLCFGGYVQYCHDWDSITYNAPYYLPVWGAGNYGAYNMNPEPLEGNQKYDRLLSVQCAKNILTVAAAERAVVNNDGTIAQPVTIADFSSQGPTDDYRIKPDIAGIGVDVWSSGGSSDRNSANTSTDSTYGNAGGTSAASPNVAGSLLLLQQHAYNLTGHYMKAATLKGLALHTADDMETTGIGPDAISGWGLLNAKKAAETITQNGKQSKIQELTLTNGQTYSFDVMVSDTSKPLQASISWTDLPGIAKGAYPDSNSTYHDTSVNDITPRLINDLDIRITKSGTTYFPYKLISDSTNGQIDNNVDPFERIDVLKPCGKYTVTVSHKGTLVNGSQNYSIILTGLSGLAIASSNASSTVCAGATTTLTASGASSYSWSTGDTTASITVSPTATKTYTVTGTSNGCASVATTTLYITPPVMAKSVTVCAASSATLTATGSTSYVWSTGATTASIVVTGLLPLSTTNYTVTGKTNGCVSKAICSVTVSNVIATITVNSPTICSGNTATLTASGSSAGYVWSTGSNANPLLVNPTVTSTYQVSSSNPGCSNTSTATVTIASITANSITVCAGATGTLTASGASSYSWSTGATTASITVTPTSTTSYTVTGIVNGCTVSKVVTATVIQKVTSNSATICSGSAATLTATGSASYSWNTGATTAAITVSPTANTNYTVTGTTSGCVSKAVATVTVNPLPTVGYTASPSATICKGNSVTLSGTGAATYSWTGGITNATAFSPTATTTTYTVTGTNANGCSKKAVATITVKALPTVTATSKTVCMGATATVTASGGTTYSWSNGKTTASMSVTPTVTTTYTVTGTTNGCSATATSTVTVIPKVSVNSATICSGSTATLTASGSTTYKWSTGPTTASISVSPTATTSYTVTGTNTCGTTTAVSKVTVTNCSRGIEVEKSTEAATEFNLYPNPSDGKVIIDYTLELDETAVVLVVDMTGRLVGKHELDSSSNQLIMDDEQLAEGTYLYKVLINNIEVKRAKIIIVK